MAKKLTIKKIQRYLERGKCCPACGERVSIEGEGISIDRTEARQERHCFNCELWWTDIYVLSRIEAGAGYLSKKLYNEELERRKHAKSKK